MARPACCLVSVHLLKIAPPIAVAIGMLFAPPVLRSQAPATAVGDDADRLALARAIELSESGDREQADFAYRQWLENRVARFGSDARETAVAWNHYGLFLKRNGQLTASRQPLQEALRIRRLRGDEEPEALAVEMSNLAGVESGLGSLERAQSLYDDALEIWQLSNPDSPLAASCHGNAGIFQETLGDTEQAEFHFQQAVRILRSTDPDSLALATQLGSLARLARASGRPTAAAEHLEAAISIREKNSDSDAAGLLSVLIEMGLLRIDQNQAEEAVTLFNQAMEMAKTSVDQVAVLTGRAQAWRRLGRSADSVRDLRKALDLAAGDEGSAPDARPEILAVLQRELAISLLDLGDRDAALDLVRSATETNLGQFRRLCSFGSARQRFAFQNAQDWYGLLARLGVNEEIAALSLMVKGAALDSTAKDHSLVARAQDQQRERLAIIGKSKDLLREAYLSGNSDSQQLAALWLKTEQKERELLRELGLEITGNLHTDGTSPMTPAELLGQIQPRHLVLDYLLYQAGGETGGGAETHYGVVAYPGGADESVWIDLGPAQTIDQQIVRFLNSADPDNPGSLAEAEQNLVTAGQSLFRLLLAPVFDRLGTNRTVVSVCPDDLIALVAFPALLDGDNRFAGESFRFRMVHRAVDAVGPNTAPPIQSALLVGDPDFLAASSAASGASPQPPLLVRLEGTGREITRLRDFLGGTGIKVTDLRRAAASESALRDALAGNGGPDIVHLATHGVFADFQKLAVTKEGLHASLPPYDPLLKSALTFAGAEPTLRGWISGEAGSMRNDGILTAAEIPETGLLNPWLVTLSACDTGLGDLLGGEGTRGLRSAFLQVGARNLVVSLWQVPDIETTDLMTDFYAKLFANGSSTPREPSMAFHEAQMPAMVRLRDQSGYQRAVNFYAAFQVYSRGAPVIE